MIDELLYILSFVAAVTSAYFWIRAARVPIPAHTGETWREEAPFADALAKQSSFNSMAAYAAAFTALLQSLAYLSKVSGFSA
jgi:hypothetical protein